MENDPVYAATMKRIAARRAAGEPEPKTFIIAFDAPPPPAEEEEDDWAWVGEPVRQALAGIAVGEVSPFVTQVEAAVTTLAKVEEYDIMKRGAGWSVDRRLPSGRWVFEARFPTKREAKRYVENATVGKADVEVLSFL